MLSGTLPPDDLGRHAPTIDSLDTEPVTFTDAEVLQAVFEMPYSSREKSLPPGLHPTTPPLLVVLAWAVPDSPWGPFAMVQARVSCRSGVRPRGFVAGCLVDTEAAAGALSSRWGLPAVPGRVRLVRRFDAVELAASLPGGPAAIELTGIDPDPLSPGDVQYTVTTTLAHTPRGLRLVQLEPEYELRRVERVRPRMDAFDARAWGPDSPALRHLAAAYPVSASIGVGDVTMPKLRYLSRPDVMAFEGTEAV